LLTDGRNYEARRRHFPDFETVDRLAVESDPRAISAAYVLGGHPVDIALIRLNGLRDALDAKIADRAQTASLDSVARKARQRRLRHRRHKEDIEVGSTSAKILRLTGARASRAFPTSFQAARKTQIWFVRWTWKGSPLSSFSPKLHRPALPRGSRFQCPAPPPGQAVLNEIRKKWSFRDDVRRVQSAQGEVPAAVPITRGFPRTARRLLLMPRARNIA
jgi:hypothetical protein